MGKLLQKKLWGHYSLWEISNQHGKMHYQRSRQDYKDL